MYSSDHIYSYTLEEIIYSLIQYFSYFWVMNNTWVISVFGHHSVSFSVCLGEPMVSSSFFIADVGKPDSIYHELTAKYLLRRVVR